jgi:hypothetical protein
MPRDGFVVMERLKTNPHLGVIPISASCNSMASRPGVSVQLGIVRRFLQKGLGPSECTDAGCTLGYMLAADRARMTLRRPTGADCKRLTMQHSTPASGTRGREFEAPQARHISLLVS